MMPAFLRLGLVLLTCLAALHLPARAATLSIDADTQEWTFSLGSGEELTLDWEGAAGVAWGSVSVASFGIGSFTAVIEGVGVASGSIDRVDFYAGDVGGQTVLIGFSMEGFEGVNDGATFTTLFATGLMSEAMYTAEPTVSFAAIGATNQDLEVTGTAVPEPGAGALLLAAGAVTALLRRRRAARD